jgi:hypothetical protein
MQTNTIESSAKSQENSSERDTTGHVKLWISGLQTEDSARSTSKFHPIDSQEIKDVLNKSLKDYASHISGEVVEVYRKEAQAYALAMLSDESVAKELVQLGKKGKVTLRGERLFVDLRSYPNSRDDTSRSGGNRSWRDDRSERKGKGKGKKG